MGGGIAFYSRSTKNKEAEQKEGLGWWASDPLPGHTIFYVAAAAVLIEPIIKKHCCQSVSVSREGESSEEGRRRHL